MYRPNTPRFNPPPVDNRRQPFNPGPNMRPPTAPGSLNESKPSSDRTSSPERKRFHSYDPQNSVGGTADPKDTVYRPTVSATVGPPPTTQHNYEQSSGPGQVPRPGPEGIKDAGKIKNIISCDLCELEFSNGQELEEHLDSKTHWDTLEYIQTHNNYDDMTIAFLQDVMLYKSRKCSRAIEDTALQALQDNDHMTKVDMFHCAACNAFVPTSALAVQNHITTQEHMAKTKEFEVRQKRLCLDKASTMMKELGPQFMSFAKGASPF